jgi:phosphotransferase system IIA component
MTVTEMGHLDDFFRVHSSDKVMVKVLSLTEVEDMYEIIYLLGDGFVVYLHDREILFPCIGKLNMAISGTM